MTVRPIYVKEIKGGVSRPGWIAEHVETRPGGYLQDSWIARTVRETFANDRITEATFRFADGSFVTYSVEAPDGPATECGFCEGGKSNSKFYRAEDGSCLHCDGTGLAPQGPRQAPEAKPPVEVSE